ncbi:MAG: HD domain-containing protein [Candidatus Eisenbacteria bacterium]|nr:HD domain-containing protein [Candidatus Eisenbacteria bacterium]
MAGVTFNKITKDAEITEMLRTCNDQLGIIGYTEHGIRHGKWVGRTAQKVLKTLGKNGREPELAGIAGYLHDLGNIVNREDHAQSGSFLAYQLLRDRGMPMEEITTVISAIGNHHEEHADPVSNVSAALILADKADVHRSRVRNPSMIKFDIHDRVNYAVQKSQLQVIPAEAVARLSLTIDTDISQVMEYFEIFMSRMIVSRRAAEYLDTHYELVVNGTRLL